jgi:hypothetical protein
MSWAADYSGNPILRQLHGQTEAMAGGDENQIVFGGRESLQATG